MVAAGLKKPKANARFRHKAIVYGREIAPDVWRICATDPLLYINGFVWTKDPRLYGATTVPFITYSEFQDNVICKLVAAIGLVPGIEAHDILIEKSRDMGATWLCLAVLDWAWRFRDGLFFEIASRKEQLVDHTDNPDSLFAKLDFIEEYLPPFLQSNRNRQKLTLKNYETGSIINGESTTGNIGRGGRRRAIMLDEFASFEENQPGSGQEALRSTRDNTRCRIMNSTPKGIGTAFYDMRQKGEAERITLHWPLHPMKKPGLYTSQNGQLSILDADYAFEPDYPFILDGKMRSVWYDGECRRAGSDIEIAQELDLNYFGAGDPFFDSRVIQRILENDVRPPLKICRAADIIPGAGGIDEVYGDALHLWCNLTAEGKPPQDAAYVMGCDISTGTGASDSVISVANQLTGEKVLRYVNNRIFVESFALIAVRIAEWFSTKKSQCFMGWEATGPGGPFGLQVTQVLDYTHVYYYRNAADIRGKRAGKPGWFSNKQLKFELLTNYRQALGTGAFINRSQSGVEQCKEYVYGPTGGIEHAKERSSGGASGNKEQHGDEVIADAVCNKMMSEFSSKANSEEERSPYSLWGRNETLRIEKLKRDHW